VLDLAGIEEDDLDVEERLRLGFVMDEDDRALDALMRSAGLDDEARSAIWESISRRTRRRRLA
jgi:hypothetical protein